MHTPRLFLRYFVSRCQGNKQRVNHVSMNVPGVAACVNGQESECPFSGNANECENSKIGESENIYESGRHIFS